MSEEVFILQQEEFAKERSAIEEFVNRIITIDMNNDLLVQQREYYQCSNFLIRPLPVDSVSGNTPQVISSLGKTIGDLRESFLALLRDNAKLHSVQDKAIFAASATSGTGKTHLAYSVGNEVPTVIIRIASTPATLSKPWHSLSSILDGYSEEHSQLAKHTVQVDKAEINLSFSKLAKRAYSHIELLVAAYLIVSQHVLDYGREVHQLSSAQLRQLLLRFHRNGVSENIIKDLFDALEQKLRVESHEKDIDGAKLEPLIKAVFDGWDKAIGSADRGEYPGVRLIVFDEMQRLLRHHPNLFIKYDRYKAITKLQGEETSSSNDNTVEHYDMANQESRGLIYAVSCLIHQLVQDHQNQVYMTGTYFSLSTVLDIDGNWLSVARQNIRAINVSSNKFTINEMINILCYYWNFSRHDLMNDIDICRTLQLFIGRPYFFVVGLFLVLPNYLKRGILLKSCNQLLDEAAKSNDQLREAALQSGSNEEGCELDIVKFRVFLVDRQKDFASYTLMPKISLFFKENCTLPRRQEVTKDHLFFRLIIAIVSNDCILHLNDDVTSDAISSTIVAVSSDHGGTSTIDLRKEEPITCELLLKRFHYLLQNSFGSVLTSFFAAGEVVGGGDRRDKMEEVLAYYLSLRTTLYMNTHNNNGIPLPELLQHLLPDFVDINSDLDILKRYTCSATKVQSRKSSSHPIDMSVFLEQIQDDPENFMHAEASATDERVDEDYRLVTDTIWISFNHLMGLDIAFIVSHINGTRFEQPRLSRVVVIQAKNYKKGGLSSSLTTLSPGLQYLSNNERSFVLDGKTFDFSKDKASDIMSSKYGYVGQQWQNYFDFYQEYRELIPCLFQSWIRISALANVPNEEQYQKIFQNSSAESPVVVVSLNNLPNSELQSSTKSLFLNPASNTGIGFPAITRRLRPITIQEAMTLLDPIKARFISEEIAKADQIAERSRKRKRQDEQEARKK